MTTFDNKQKNIDYSEIHITDELLEKLGFEKTLVTYENRDKLLQDFLKYPLVNNGIKWNNFLFHNNKIWFRLRYNTFLEKHEETNNYLLFIFDVTNEWVSKNKNTLNADIKELIQIEGPFAVTGIYTVEELYNLLSVLHIDFEK